MGDDSIGGEYMANPDSLPKTVKQTVGIQPAFIILSGLREITLPSLERPGVGPLDPPTEALVSWGVRSYAYSSIAHIRTILSALAMLLDGGNQPAILILGRHLFEWTMHACYMIQGFKTAMDKGDLNAAWSLFLDMDTGNGWIKRHGAKYFEPPDSEEIPGTIRINKLVAAYKKYQMETHKQENVEDDYGYLSEHAHANGTCFLDYRQIEGSTLRFVEPPKAQDFPGVIHACSTEWLLCLHEILVLSREDQVRLEVLKLLKSLANQATAAKSH
jgi:hypothetical protein